MTTATTCGACGDTRVTFEGDSCQACDPGRNGPIAAATGDSKDTVARDLSVVANETPEPDEPRSVTGTDGKTSRRIAWTTAADILATDYPPPKFAVDGLIAEGLTILAGRPKLGKSWLALSVALAVAAGGHALGKIPVQRGKVALLALEDTPRRLQTRMRMLLGDDPVPDGLGITCEAPPLDEGLLDHLDALDTGNLRLAVVDVLQRVRPRGGRSESVYERDYMAAAALKSWSDRHTVPVLALHHDRKAAADDWLDTVSGSLGLTGAADAIALMRRSRGDADAELHVTGRDIEDAAHALRFDPTRGAWTLLGDAAEWSMGETRRRLLTAVRERGSLTPKAAATATGLDYELVKKTLLRMAEADQLATANGSYTPVPAVPAVPDDLDEGHEGHEGHPLQLIGPDDAGGAG